MEEEINRWYKKLWETKGSRFVAAKRLELHEKLSTITVSLISVYIISLNLVVLFPETDRYKFLNDMNITYSTVCLSVLVLVVSLIIASRNYRMRADKYHECGRRIDEIYSKICIWKSMSEFPSKYELLKVSEDYLKLLDKYENHTNLDYLIFKADNIGDYKKIKWPNIFWIRVKLYFYIQTIGMYIIVIVSPLVLLLI